MFKISWYPRNIPKQESKGREREDTHVHTQLLNTVTNEFQIS